MQDSETKKVQCPDCEGEGENLAFGIIYAEGHSGPFARMFPCNFCKGKKEVPAVMLEWVERGKAIRQWRRSQEMTLHDVAVFTGLRPSEVSMYENGYVDNSRWEEDFKIKSC